MVKLENTVLPKCPELPGWPRGHLPSKNPMFNQFLSQRTGRKCVLYQRPVVVTWPSVKQKWRSPAYSYFGSSSSYFGSTSVHLLLLFEKKTRHFGFIICEQEWTCHWRLKNCKLSKKLYLFPYFLNFEASKLEGHTYKTGIFVLL